MIVVLLLSLLQELMWYLVLCLVGGQRPDPKQAVTGMMHIRCGTGKGPCVDYDVAGSPKVNR
jgi:hypothetical protein